MKKRALAVIAALFVANIVCAADLDLSKFPVSGKWSDPQWGALWELSSTGIRLLDAKTEKVIADFSKLTISNFKVDVGLSGASISWSCKSTLRDYVISKGTGLDTDLTLTVTPQWKQGAYTTTMKMAGASLPAVPAVPAGIPGL
ncbi:MAG: hypothetical protein LBR16_01415 [Treponema sp.]|jgi:hypothetical protein|nr:hypothetical protein [Treponema sp.]